MRDRLQLHVVRGPNTKGFFRGHWLRGDTETLEEALSEGQALVDDPRDDIVLVSFWSHKREQFLSQVVRRRPRRERR